MHGLADLKGVGPALADALSKSGITSTDQVAKASVEDLTAVPGIGPARARMLIAAAEALGGTVPATAAEPTAKRAEKSKQPKAKRSKNTVAKKDKKDEKKKKKKAEAKAKAKKADAKKSKKPKKSGKKKDAKKSKKASGKKAKKSKKK